jgi:hypothetical protein
LRGDRSENQLPDFGMADIGVSASWLATIGPGLIPRSESHRLNERSPAIPAIALFLHVCKILASARDLLT